MVTNELDSLFEKYHSFATELNDQYITSVEEDLSELTVNQPESFKNSEQAEYDTVSMDGLLFERDDTNYFIYTHPDLDYSLVVFAYNSVDEIAAKEETDYIEQEHYDQLAESRRSPSQDVRTNVMEVASQGSCSYFLYSDEPYSDIHRIEISKKIFPDTSIEEFDNTVQEVINSGQRATLEYISHYDLDLINPKFIQQELG